MLKKHFCIINVENSCAAYDFCGNHTFSPLRFFESLHFANKHVILNLCMTQVQMFNWRVKDTCETETAKQWSRRVVCLLPVKSYLEIRKSQRLDFGNFLLTA